MPSADNYPAALDAPLRSPSRPSWRGRVHLIALWSAIPLLVVLAIESNGARSRAASIVYGVGLCSMLAVSTTYHRLVHTIRAPLALTSLPNGPAIAMMVIIWSAAAIGAAFKVFSFQRAHRLGAATYLALGWSGLALVPAVRRGGGLLAVGLLLGGGILYTVGAVGFGRQWPTLRPARFSYHEVWQTYTIAAAGLHFAVVYRLAT